MIFNLPLSTEFKSNAYRLTHLEQEGHNLYKDLRDFLKFMREMGLSNIGNPVTKLENEVLTLVYKVMQHEINCDLYDELLTENSSDQELQAQLSSLYEITNDLAKSYQSYLGKWTIIKSQQREQMIARAKLISA